MAVRDRVDDPAIGRPPAVQPGHRRGAEGFVEENEAVRVDPGPDDLPRGPLGGDVRPVPLGRPERLFLRLRPNARSAYQMLAIEASRFRSRLRSSRVVPGCSATRARMASPRPSASDRRLLARDFGANGRPARCRRLIEFTHDPLTPSTSAISGLDSPSSVSSTTRCRYSTG